MSKWAPEFNIDSSGYHDALFDCEMMFKMFMTIIDTMKENIGLDISIHQDERIRSIK